MRPERFLVLALAAGAGLLAAVIAYLVSYQEYSRHLPDKHRVIRISLGIAAASFLFFLALGAVLALALPYII